MGDPSGGARRWGWTSVPVKCPRCGKRIREHAIITHGGAARCDRGCDSALYVLPAFQHGVAFVVEVTPAEMLNIRALGLDVLGTLDALGCGFPVAS